jgi:hypothetical protein
MKPDAGMGFGQRKSKSVYRGRQETVFSRLNRIPVIVPLAAPLLGVHYKPLPLNNSPKELSVSWESNPAGVKASKNFNIYYK